MMNDFKEFRNVCGKFATGVTIVTSKSKDGEIFGMTVNGFMSVSLDPPLIVVSIGKNQFMHKIITDTGSYGVSVLNDSQIELSNHFAGMTNPDLQVDFSEINDIPYLSKHLGCFLANVTERVDAGDHTLFIGEVIRFEKREGEPLLFYQGKYKTISEI